MGLADLMLPKVNGLPKVSILHKVQTIRLWYEKGEPDIVTGPLARGGVGPFERILAGDIRKCASVEKQKRRRSARLETEIA